MVSSVFPDLNGLLTTPFITLMNPHTINLYEFPTADALTEALNLPDNSSLEILPEDAKILATLQRQSFKTIGGRYIATILPPSISTFEEGYFDSNQSADLTYYLYLTDELYVIATISVTLDKLSNPNAIVKEVKEGLSNHYSLDFNVVSWNFDWLSFANQDAKFFIDTPKNVILKAPYAKHQINGGLLIDSSLITISEVPAQGPGYFRISQNNDLYYGLPNGSSFLDLNWEEKWGGLVLTSGRIDCARLITSSGVTIQNMFSSGLTVTAGNYIEVTKSEISIYWRTRERLLLPT